MKKHLSIEGMSCGHCVARITAALTGVAGVASAHVDISTKSAVVEGERLDDEALKAAVADAGYTVGAIDG